MKSFPDYNNAANETACRIDGASATITMRQP
jgi:hypothetical protein